MRSFFTQSLIRVLFAQQRPPSLSLGLSQEKLAQRAGLNRNYIRGIEQGRRDVAVVNLVRLAVALELDPGELLANLHKTRR